MAWRTFSCFLSDPKDAEIDAGSDGTFFEVDLMSARSIRGYTYAFSQFPLEDHIVMMPYSSFQITSITKKDSGVTHICMREVMTPRSNKIIFWVDDEPRNDQGPIRAAEMNGISAVCCTNTEEALTRIRNYQWMIHLDGTKVRIVTDHTRKELDENGNVYLNHKAGVEFIERLRGEVGCVDDVMMYCGDVERARKELEGVRGVCVESRGEKMYEFIMRMRDEK